MQHVTLKLTVLVPWRVGHRKKVIGYVKVGADTDPILPSQHWNDMLANPRRAIAAWHQLIEVIKE